MSKGKILGYNNNQCVLDNKTTFSTWLNDLKLMSTT